jgi:hypothetical protein
MLLEVPRRSGEGGASRRPNVPWEGLPRAGLGWLDDLAMKVGAVAGVSAHAARLSARRAGKADSVGEAPRPAAGGRMLRSPWLHLKGILFLSWALMDGAWR